MQLFSTYTLYYVFGLVEICKNYCVFEVHVTSTYLNVVISGNILISQHATCGVHRSIMKPVVTNSLCSCVVSLSTMGHCIVSVYNVGLAWCTNKFNLDQITMVCWPLWDRNLKVSRIHKFVNECGYQWKPIFTFPLDGNISELVDLTMNLCMRISCKNKRNFCNLASIFWQLRVCQGCDISYAKLRSAS